MKQSQIYNREIQNFRHQKKTNKHWVGVPKVEFDFKNNYLILSGHDALMLVGEKYGLFEKTGALVKLSAFSNALLSQTFVKRHVTTDFGHTYAFTAPKKRVDRFIRQNFNRFLERNKK